MHKFGGTYIPSRHKPLIHMGQGRWSWQVSCEIVHPDAGNWHAGNWHAGNWHAGMLATGQGLARRTGQARARDFHPHAQAMISISIYMYV